MLLILTAAAFAVQATPPLCQDAKTRLAESRAKRPRVHPLNQEPDARQTLTVLREQDGCTRPVNVRERVGHRPTR